MSELVKMYFTKMQRETSSGDHSRKWSKMKNLLESHNWHLLGKRLLCLTRESLWNDERALLALHDECIVYLKSVLEPYTLIDIVEVIVRAMRIENKPLQLLLNLHDNVQHDAEALQYMRIIQGHLLFQRYFDNEAARLIVEELRLEIEEHPNEQQLRNFIKYHIFAATFYFRIGEWSKSFNSRMKYLDSMIQSEPNVLWAEQAYLLVVNSLLIPDKFEFEDIKKHRILDSLRESEWEWALEVLSAFSAGNLERFKKLRFFWMLSAELYQNSTVLYQRIYVLTFLSVAAKRTNLPCYIHFVEVAMELGMAAADVIGAVRRAINTGLVEAKINLFDEVVEVYSLKAMYVDQND